MYWNTPKTRIILRIYAMNPKDNQFKLRARSEPKVSHLGLPSKIQRNPTLWIFGGKQSCETLGSNLLFCITNS